ncbi:MAG: hypothetical protein JST86_09860 [Bacteroidetes bacterium]|nr:hypothetical protein [Bacteroidota bacterium]
MFNNVVLDVFIGLVFIFLLYSLLATILQEIVARLLNLRSKLLLNAIRIMLEDRDEETDEDRNPLWRTIARFFDSSGKSMTRYFTPLPQNKFIRVFYKSPSIKYLGESKWQGKPSYLEPGNFSSTIISLLRGKEYDGAEPQMDAISRTLFDANQNTVSVSAGKKVFAASIEPETLKHLQQLFLDAHKDADRFKSLLENWFNETMDRATGWYKRQTQWILFAIGLLLAISFNIDTIAIYRILAKDKTARENLVQLAVNSAPRYDSTVKKLQAVHRTDTTHETLKNKAGQDSMVTRIKDTTFVDLSDKELTNAYDMVESDINSASSIAAIGWEKQDSCVRCNALNEQLKDSSLKPVQVKAIRDSITYYNRKFQCGGNPYQSKNGWVVFFGWLLTALAVSLGAPFWFDLLNRFIQLRTTGVKPKGNGDTNTGPGNTSQPAAPGSSPVQRVG